MRAARSTDPAASSHDRKNREDMDAMALIAYGPA